MEIKKKIGSSINPDISGALITLIKPISELNLPTLIYEDYVGTSNAPVKV